MSLTASPPVRRSGRRRPHQVNYNEDENEVILTDNEEERDSSVISVTDSELDDIAEDSEEEYVPEGQRKRKAKSGNKTAKAKETNKRRKGTIARNTKASSKQSAKEFYQQLEENLHENFLFQSFLDEETSVAEIANDWLEQYQMNKPGAIKDLVNLMLRACGCLLQVEQHDVGNVEVAPDTVSEIQGIFIKQKVHEFPFLSKSKHFKFFKKNFTEFIKKLILLSNEKNMLFGEEDHDEADEEPEFLENILIWLSSLSTCNIRSLRYVSTVVLLTIENTICEILIKITKSYDKNQSNLSNANEKLIFAQKTLAAKNIKRTDKLQYTKEEKRYKKHIETITRNLEFYNRSKNTLQEYLADIFDTIFVHRFKDVDPKIRVECIRSLYHWIELYPEFFFENSFLKYFGWLIFDSDNQVKIEVLKALTKLYKKNNSLSGLKQFTERFKINIIDLLVNDADYNIKINCLHLLVEINSIGFLEEEEVLRINNMAFKLLKQDSDDMINEFNNVSEVHKQLKDNDKLLNELIKFLNFIEVEKTNELKEQHKLSITNATGQFTIDIDGMIKFKTLIQIINQSKNYYMKHNEDNPNDDQLLEKDFDIIVRKYNNESNEALRKLLYDTKESHIYLNEISRIGLLLYKNFSEYFNSWKFLISYFNIDFSSVKLDNLLKQIIELNDVEEFFLLNLLYGILYGALTKEPINYYIEEYNTSDKKKKRLTKKDKKLMKQAEQDAEKAAETAVLEAKLKLANMNVEQKDERQQVEEPEQPEEEEPEEEEEKEKEEEVVVEEEEEEEEDDDEDDGNTNKAESEEKILGRVVNSLPFLFDKYESIHHNFKVMLKIFLNLMTFAKMKELQQDLTLQKLVKKVLSVFENYNNYNEIVDLKNDFLKFFIAVKASLEVNELTNDIKILIQNTVIELSLELSNEIGGTGSPNTLATNINVALEKSIIIGQAFNVSEFIDASTFAEISNKILAPLVFTDLIDTPDEGSSSLINNVELIFKFYLNFCSWKLAKLFEFGTNDSDLFLADDLLQTNRDVEDQDNKSLVKYFSTVETIVSQLKSFVVENFKSVDDFNVALFKVKTLASKYLISLLISLKIFHSKFKDNSKLANYFIDFDYTIKSQINLDINKELLVNLISSYLHLESNLAILLDVQLERNDSESVNYGYITEEASDPEDKENEVFNAESELVGYTLKLLDLRNAKLVSKEFIQRLNLNKDKLGGIYATVVNSKDNIDIFEEYQETLRKEQAEEELKKQKELAKGRQEELHKEAVKEKEKVNDSEKDNDYEDDDGIEQVERETIAFPTIHVPQSASPSQQTQFSVSKEEFATIPATVDENEEFELLSETTSSATTVSRKSRVSSRKSAPDSNVAKRTSKRKSMRRKAKSPVSSPVEDDTSDFEVIPLEEET